MELMMQEGASVIVKDAKGIANGVTCNALDRDKAADRHEKPKAARSSDEEEDE